jgi:ABC-type multidrug transport system fused ATPase/permease subunit
MSTLIQKPTIIQTQEEKRMNAIQEVMKKGDDAQEQTKNSLKEMNQMVERGIEMAADINLELNKQIEQLDRMNDKVKDTESTLKKAQRNITYFARAMECDMCMAGLLVLILLALVTVVVLAVKKNDKN